MMPLLEAALSNVLMAAALAVPAALAGRWGRRPALTHGLWVLVLLKLVTPPLVYVPVAWPEAPAPQAAAPEPEPALPEEPAPPPAGPIPADAELPPAAPAPLVAEALPLPPLPIDPPVEPAPPADVVPAADAAGPTTEPAMPSRAWLVLPWLAGSIAWLFVMARRLERFRRLLRFARPATAAVQKEAQALARRLGVRCPRVLTLPGTLSPMLWSTGRSPCVLLPAGLIERLSATQRTTLLAHELAHWKRGDHRVRWLELLVLALYWWCPLAWVARGQLRQAEEECCDAWVVALLPDAARDYALALVETIDFLSGAPSALPPSASGVGHVRLLQRRLTMILRGSTPQSLTRTGLLMLAGLALVLLPFVPSQAQQAPKPPAPGEADTRDLAVQALERLGVAQDDGAARKEDLEARRAQLERELKKLQDAINGLNAQRGGLAPSTPAGGVPKAAPSGQKPYTGNHHPLPLPPMPHVQPPSADLYVTPGKPGNVNQRLEQIERKLDALLWEVTNLRRDLTRKQGTVGTRASQGAPGGVPGTLYPDAGSAFPGAPPSNVPGSLPRGSTPPAATPGSAPGSAAPQAGRP